MPTPRIDVEPQLQTVAGSRRPKLTRPKTAQKEQIMASTPDMNQTPAQQKGNSKAANALRQMQEELARKSPISAQLTDAGATLSKEEQVVVGHQLLDAQAKGLSWDARLIDTITRHPYTGPVVRVLGYAAFVGGLVTGLGGLAGGVRFGYRKIFPVKMPIDIPPAM